MYLIYICEVGATGLLICCFLFAFCVGTICYVYSFTSVIIVLNIQTNNPYVRNSPYSSKLIILFLFTL